MASAGTVTVDFAAETARFTAELKKVRSELNGMNSTFKSLADIAKIATAAFSAGAIISFVRSAAQAADELGKTADKIGVTTERLAAFRLAADDAGVSVATMDKLLVDAQRRLGEAAAGKGEAANFIKLLRLDVQDLQALAPDQLFLKYADAIGTLANRSDRFAAAQALFGKSAQEAFNLIEAGRPAIDDAQASVDRYGLALSRIDVAKIEIANDKIGLLGKISEAAGQRIAAGLAPFIQAVSQGMLDATGNTETLQRRVEQFGAVAYTAFQIVANGVHSLEAAFFSLVAANARVMQFLTFGDTSKEFAGFVDSNLARARTALDEIKSISQIQQSIVGALEASRDAAGAQVAARQNAPTGTASIATNTFGEDLQKMQAESERLLTKQSESVQREIVRVQREVAREVRAGLDEQNAAYRGQAEYRVFLEKQTQERLTQFKQDGFNAAQSLLTAYGGKYKALASAILAFEKSKAIAKVIVDTKAAVMATFAQYGATPWGYAAAAGMAVLGAAQVAAIASTAIGGGSNSPDLGSPNNPVFTDRAGSGSSSESQPGATAVPSAQIFINGYIGRDQIDEMIEALRNDIGVRDVVIIPRNSTQAAILKEG